MAVDYGSLPFKQAVAFFLSKVNLPTASWTDIWQEQHDKSFVVAGAIKADLLEDLHSALRAAIESGTTLHQFRKDFDAIVLQHGWPYKGNRNWRTRVIYDTNLRQSYNAGRERQMLDPELRKRRPYGLYRHSDAVQHPRPKHVAWDSLVLPLDDPWWKTHSPSNGWGCQCKKFMVSDRDLKRRGLKVGGAPPIEWVEKTVGSRGPNPRTVQVPVGIDPGFAYQPGTSDLANLKQATRQKAAALAKPIGAALTQAVDNLPPVPPPPGVGSMAAFSTVKGVDQAVIDKLFDQLPSNPKQREQLTRFLEANPVKALFLKQSELGYSNKAASKVSQTISQFLGKPPNRYHFTIRRPTRVNGFTSALYEHVVVKVKAGDKLAGTRAEDLATAVERAIERAEAGQHNWSIRATLDQLTGGNPPGQFATLIHELGHQVHYRAGSPVRPNIASFVTEYAYANKFEWHAEHFTAWLFNREALARWNPQVAQYFDELLESAILNVVKVR